MNCKKCGAPLVNGDQFCKDCGEPVNFQTNIIGGEAQTNMQNFQAPKQSSNVVKYIIALIIIIAIVCGTLVTINVLNKDKKVADNDTGSGTNPTPIVSKSTYEISYEGFKLNIPNELESEIDEEFLFLGNESWVAQIGLVPAKYYDIKNNMSNFQSKFQQGGYDCSTAVEKNLNGVDYVTLEVSNDAQKSIVAYARANEAYSFIVVVTEENGGYNYSLLEKISPIISSATYVGKSNSIKTDLKIDVNLAADALK